MSDKVIFLALAVPHETLLWAEREGVDVMKDLLELDSDRFAALCVAVKRAANEREKVNGHRVKLGEE